MCVFSLLPSVLPHPLSIERKPTSIAHRNPRFSRPPWLPWQPPQKKTRLWRAVGPSQPPKRPKKRISRASCGRWDIENERWNPHPKPQAVRALLWTWVSIALEGEHSPQKFSVNLAWRKRERPTCLVGSECSWISLYTRNHCNSGKSSFVELWGRYSFSHIGFFFLRQWRIHHLSSVSTLVTFHEIMVLCISGMVVITFGSCFWGPEKWCRGDIFGGGAKLRWTSCSWRRCGVPSWRCPPKNKPCIRWH